MTEFCRTCKAPIRWARTVGGHAMPLDFDPVANGNLRLEPPTNGKPPRVYVVPASYRKAGEQLFVSHLSVCPYADRRS